MSEMETKKEGIIGRFFKSDCERRLDEARQLLHKLEISFLKSNIPEEKWEVLEELRKKLE